MWGTYEKVKQQIRKSSSLEYIQLKMKNSIWEFAGFHHFENYQSLEIKTNTIWNTSFKKPQIPMTKISSALDMIKRSQLLYVSIFCELPDKQN
jgi:hypothetical protein